MINWNIFDKIYCIHYLPYKDRLASIKKELERIDILNRSNFEFYYTVPNKYYDFLFWDKKIKQKLDLNCLCVRNLNYTLNTYNLMSIIRYKKYKRILIIEDDVSFLKDIDLISNIISKYPLQYNIVNFEPYIWCRNKKYNEEYLDILNNNDEINDMYIDIDYNRKIYDTGCISFDYSFVEYFLDSQNNLLKPFDHYFKKTDKLKYCIPKIHLCIQKNYTDRQNYSVDCDDKYSYLNKQDYD